MSQNNLIVNDETSLVKLFADKYSIEPEKLLTTLKSTAFKQDNNTHGVSNEQMAALLVVAHQYNLNPFTRELFAFPHKGGIVPIVGLDGWSRIVNDQTQCDGFEFKDVGKRQKIGPGKKPCPDGVECSIYRKDRGHPIKVTEYIDECYRNTQAWNSHPRRMLRHKALIQCARLAFGFGGIYDQDEGERVLEGEISTAEYTPAAASDLAGGSAAAVNDMIKDAGSASHPAAATTDDDIEDATIISDDDEPVTTSLELTLRAINDADTVDALDYIRSRVKESMSGNGQQAALNAIEGRVRALARDDGDE